MVSLHVQAGLVQTLQDRETLRDVIAEALGTKTEPVAKKEVTSYEEVAELFAAAGGLVF